MRLICHMFWTVAAVFFACGPTAHPLSITLYDPKTQAVRNCSARESRPTDVAALAAAVEACARALEAQGYIREKNLER